MRIARSILAVGLCQWVCGAFAADVDTSKLPPSATNVVSFDEHTLYYCPACQTEGRVLADRRLSRLLRE